MPIETRTRSSWRTNLNSQGSSNAAQIFVRVRATDRCSGGTLGGVGFLSADNWAVNRELIEAINAIAAEAIAAARLPVEDHLHRHCR
jgi:hypothetical protein